MTAKERYGVEDMTFAEEMELWEKHPSKAQTRADKICMAEHISAILSEAMNLLPVIKTIPEDDNEFHANAVHQLAEEIESIRKKFTSCYCRHAYGEK